MKFSVIIPVYNGEKYLADCLCNLLKRDYMDFEVIIVDDGSTDATPFICDEYENKNPDRITVIHQENKGQLLTRWNAIKQAHGEYVVFLDVDDSFTDDYFEKLCDIIERNNNPDIVIFSFYYDRSGKLEKSVPIYEKETYYSDKISLCRHFFDSIKLNNVWSKAVKRSIFDKEFPDFQPYARLRMAEDRLFSMGVADNCSTAVFSPEPLYLYKVLDDSISHSFTLDRINNYNTAILYQPEKEYLKKWGLLNEKSLASLKASYLIATVRYLGLFYNAVAKNDRASVPEFDWTSFFDDECYEGYADNPYINGVTRMLLEAIVNKDFRTIKRYYFKKNARKKIKQLIKG